MWTIAKKPRGRAAGAAARQCQLRPKVTVADRDGVTRGPGQYTDVTLWFVLHASHDMPLGCDGTEFRGLLGKH